MPEQGDLLHGVPSSHQGPPLEVEGLTDVKEELVGRLKNRIDGFFVSINGRARDAVSSVETIRERRGLNEAREIGCYIEGELRRGDDGRLELVREIGRNIKEANALLESQINEAQRNFGGERGEEYGVFRFLVRNWQGGRLEEFIKEIRKAFEDPIRGRQKLEDLREEFHREVVKKIQEEAERLRPRAVSFERNSYEIGDQAIRKISRAGASLEDLYKKNLPLYKQVAERISTLLVETQSYYRKTKEAREALPQNLRILIEETTRLGVDINQIFEEFNPSMAKPDVLQSATPTK